MFEERGYEMVQGGCWIGDSRFAFFESKGQETGTCFETIAFAEGWEYPVPDEWFPVEAEEGSSQ